MDAEDEKPDGEEPSTAPQNPGAGLARSIFGGSGSAISRILKQQAMFSTPQMDEIRRVISSTALQLGASDAMRRAIVGLPKSFELPAFKFTTDVANLIIGPSALSGILAAQEASMRLRSDELAAAFESQLTGSASAMGRFREQMAGLTSTSNLVEAMALSVRDLRFPMLIERSFAVSNQGWDEATRAIVEGRNPDRLFPLQALGRGTAGVVASGILLGGRNEEDETAEESATLLARRRIRNRTAPRERCPGADPSSLPGAR